MSNELIKDEQIAQTTLENIEHKYRDLLTMCIEKMSKDQSELRSDLRENERHISDKVEHLDKTTDIKMCNIEKAIEDTSETFKKTSEESSESMQKSMKELEKSIRRFTLIATSIVICIEIASFIGVFFLLR